MFAFQPASVRGGRPSRSGRSAPRCQSLLFIFFHHFRIFDVDEAALQVDEYVVGFSVDSVCCSWLIVEHSSPEVV